MSITEQAYGKTPRSLIFDGKLVQAFCMVTGAKDGGDVAWIDGQSVQIVNPDRDYVRVQFTNIKGKDGWCSRSGADKTAFLFPRGFVVVDTVELMRYCQMKVLQKGHSRVIRTNSIAYETAVHCMWGTPGKSDAFTVIYKKELGDIAYEFYKVV